MKKKRNVGLVSAFKGIGKGFVKVRKAAGGVDVIDDALEHPAADPSMAVLSVFVPEA